MVFKKECLERGIQVLSLTATIIQSQNLPCDIAVPTKKRAVGVVVDLCTALQLDFPCSFLAGVRKPVL
jgi:hypothetical protein